MNPVSTPTIHTVQMQLLNRVYDPATTGRVKWYQFIATLNAHIDHINRMIEQYNKCSDIHSKVQQLQAIYEENKRICGQFSDRHVRNSPGYQAEIHQKLFTELKTQFAYFGVNSLQEDVVYSRAQNHALSDSPLAIFTNMMPDKFSKILGILSSPYINLHDLRTLYDPIDSEYEPFQRFLQAYDIKPLGGKNSKNYTITPTPARQSQTSEGPCVLKIENRMGLPKWIDTTLRATELNTRLTPIMTERQGNFQIYGKPATRSLQITQLCTGGNVEQHAATNQNDTDSIKFALSIYKQMADILIQLNKHQCVFLDMKNTNWLLDENQFLTVSDTKGLAPIDSHGIYSEKKAISKGFDFLSSEYMNPPEMRAEQSHFLADKAHAFMLGKNLYQYLTKAKEFSLKRMDNGLTYDFSAAIFKSDTGKALEELIKALIKPNPSDRLSVNDALQMLTTIENAFNLYNKIREQSNIKEQIHHLRDTPTITPYDIDTNKRSSS